MSTRTGPGDKPARNVVHGPSASDQIAAMLRIRRFEEQCFGLSKTGQLLGHYHVYIGQEATAVAACAALVAEDFPLDCRGRHRFGAHGLDRELLPVFRPEMLCRTGILARFEQKQRLCIEEPRLLPGKLEASRIVASSIS